LHAPHSRKVPQPSDAIIYGVVSENTKFQSHCEATPMAIPGSLIRAEKILMDQSARILTASRCHVIKLTQIRKATA
jgi:hypothetical protein